jgi:hypothetical protein
MCIIDESPLFDAVDLRGKKVCGVCPLTVLDSLFVAFLALYRFILLIGLSLLLRLQSALIVWSPKAKAALIARFSRVKAGRSLAREASGAADAVPADPNQEPPAVYGEPDDASEIIISPVPGTCLK